MIHPTLFLLPLAVVALSLLFFIPARSTFLVRIKGGTVRSMKGRNIEDVVDACTEALALFPQVSGEVRGVRRGNTLHLYFSRSIPEVMRHRVTAALEHGGDLEDPTPSC